MQKHYEEYHLLLAKAHAAHDDGLYAEVIDCAVKCWPHIDGMMRYGERYEDESFESIEAISLVLDHAPLLFDLASLRQLEELLRSRRRIEKKTDESLADQLATASENAWRYHSLFSALEQSHGVELDKLPGRLGGSKKYWLGVIDDWERMGVVWCEYSHDATIIHLRTRMDGVTRAKCSGCGSIGEAPKSMFLESTRCPSCQTMCDFVLLTPRELGGI